MAFQRMPLNSGEMIFNKLPEENKLSLARIHRQSADNPILDLAHMLGQDALAFEDFEEAVRDAARTDDRVQVVERADADLQRLLGQLSQGRAGRVTPMPAICSWSK